jgi:gliding motility-associated-like protein
LKGKDEIKELFSDKLGGYEAKVNPALWGNVASQIGAGAAATATGMSLTTKLIIGLSAASVVTVGTVALLSNDDTTQENTIIETPLAENKEEVKQTETTLINEEVKSDLASDVETNDTPSDTYVYVPEPAPSVIPTPISEPEPEPEILPFMVATPGPVHVVVETPKQIAAPEPVYPDPEVVDPVEVPEENLITERSQEIDVVFPNVFTPNKDGVNDYLFIKNPEQLDASSFGIVILDGSNKEVYKSTDPNFRWDGYSAIRGEMLSAGRYIAIITCKDNDGNQAKPVMRMFTIVK